MHPHPHLTLDHVKQLEAQVIAICNHCTTLEELTSAGNPLWDWACQVLNTTPDKLRGEIESHETDEQFASKYLEEKDHLLKLPLVLLEHLNQQS
jgi:hypothetical protein